MSTDYFLVCHACRMTTPCASDELSGSGTYERFPGAIGRFVAEHYHHDGGVEVKWEHYLHDLDDEFEDFQMQPEEPKNG